MWVFLGMIVICLAIVAYPGAIGLNPAVGSTLTRMIPTLLLISIGIYMLYHGKPSGKFGGMMCIGLALCLFLDQADTEGLITVAMLDGLTLIQIQMWVMAISTIFGAILFSSKV